MEAYVASYEKTHGLTSAGVGEWAQKLNSAAQVQTDMTVQVLKITEHGETYYAVDGVDSKGQTWALDFTPWNEWAAMPVVDLTGEQLTTDQLAAHVLYEMSWHGTEESMEAKRDELTDASEKLDRDLASGVPLEQLGYKEWKPGQSLDDFLKDDDG